MQANDYQTLNSRMDQTINIGLYLKLILVSLMFNVSWAFISTFLEYSLNPENENPDGLILGSGFIFIHALTFFLILPALKRTLKNLFVLIFSFAFIFLTSTFLLPALTINVFFNIGKLMNSDIGSEAIVLLSSFFSSAAIVLVINNIIHIHKKSVIICLATFLTSLLIYLTYKTDLFDTEGIKRIIHPLAMGFCIWQILTALTIGIPILNRKPAHNNRIKQGL